MSRDVHRIGNSFDCFRLFSMWCSGNGLFASSALMFAALYWFAVTLALLSLIGLERFTSTVDGEVYTDVNGKGTEHVYSSEWFVQMGFVLMWPLFLEYCGLGGFGFALREVGSDLRQAASKSLRHCSSTSAGP